MRFYAEVGTSFFMQRWTRDFLCRVEQALFNAEVGMHFLMQRWAQAFYRGGHALFYAEMGMRLMQRWACAFYA